MSIDASTVLGACILQLGIECCSGKNDAQFFSLLFGALFLHHRCPNSDILVDSETPVIYNFVNLENLMTRSSKMFIKVGFAYAFIW